MTDIQVAKLKEANDILGEHFDTHVICVLMVDSEKHTESHAFARGGGFTAAIGMLGIIKDILLAGQHGPLEQGSPETGGFTGQL
jgi:hypothetical protein